MQQKVGHTKVGREHLMRHQYVPGPLRERFRPNGEPSRVGC